MIDSFYMNGYFWRVKVVDRNSEELIDRTGERTVATTDPDEHCVYLSDQLRGTFLARVFIHELGHCAMVSFDLIDYIHTVVHPDYWIDVEEFICNFIADYGVSIFKIARDMVGEKAMSLIPTEIEKVARFIA